MAVENESIGLPVVFEKAIVISVAKYRQLQHQTQLSKLQKANPSVLSVFSYFSTTGMEGLCLWMGKAQNAEAF